ncbi:MAG: HepT-like ribonuclease domain-containing protein [Thiobacillaceae bacterium]
MRIEDYVHQGRAAFFQDHKTQDAVIRNLEVIGQAVKDIGSELLATDHPTIPWMQIAGTRNILAHQYLGADLNLVWNIVENNLPALKIAIRETATRMAIKLSDNNTN